jgi:uncharacterized coiled-coil DUF342 family protein
MKKENTCNHILVKKNHEMLFDIKKSINKISSDVDSIQEDLKDIRKYIAVQKIEDEKLKTGFKCNENKPDSWWWWM